MWPPQNQWWQSARPAFRSHAGYDLSNPSDQHDDPDHDHNGLAGDGGDRGGRIVAAGTPEDVARVAGSHTGSYLVTYLGMTQKPKKKRA